MLHLHRSERADLLLEPLAELLLEPLEDPMAREVVAVPTRGVERWLTQSLSHRLGATGRGDDGVCANIDWPFPGALVYMATAAASGLAVGEDWRGGAGNDPWSPQRLVWPLVEVVDESLGEEFLEPLAGHLRSSSAAQTGEPPRRFAAVRHIADLFDSYSVHRPEMVLGWLEGLDGEPVPGGLADGHGEPAPHAQREDIAWQAELFRRLRRRVGAPSFAERLSEAPSLLAARPELLPLPSRLSVFGLTRLPASYLRVLLAIAARRDVHLFLLHPSGALWDKVEAKIVAHAIEFGRLVPRRDDATSLLAANPLLRSWGRDAREMQLVLASAGVHGGQHLGVPQSAQTTGSPLTLLQLLQADVRADRQPGTVPAEDGHDQRPVLSDSDKSLQVHSCHGRARQVEVAREAVLHLLAEDPSLEPRDVVIMCPDIEVFAPFITATFGNPGRASPEDERGPALRARLADRSLRQTNPLLAVAAHVLELAASRVSAPQVLDFASREVVRRRFHLKEEDLPRIEEWVPAMGARWGFDSEHREAGWKLGAIGELATWRAGLDRLLLGVAMAGTPQPLAGTLPLEDVSSTDIELVGRFTELVERLRATLLELSPPQPAASWAEALARGTERLACPAPGEDWQRDQLRRLLEEVAGAAGGDRPLLDLAEASYLLADRLRGRPTRANFRTGDITICTLVPMRSVPHRVVCLLGLDASSFPRRADQDGDDLMLAEPRVGDRDAGSEDRQLLLDALLAAKEHLIVTYEGKDQRQNRQIPPAVPVAELLDLVDHTVRHPEPARRAREMVLVEHPLQAFDPRNYAAGQLGTASPWRFDRLNLDGALSLLGERLARRAFLEHRLAPPPGATVRLRSLLQFLEAPVRAFLRERLGFYTRTDSERLSERLPLDLEPLEAWGLGDRLLASVLAGSTLDGAVAVERSRGLLPPPPLGDSVLAGAINEVDALLAKAKSLPGFSAPGASLEVNVNLPDGRCLVGTVPNVRSGRIAICTYSRLKPKQRLQAWAQLVAISVAHPRFAPSAVTVGRSEGSRPTSPRPAVQSLGPLGASEDEVRANALAILCELVDLYDRGMREPLPLYCETSAAWAAAKRAGEDAQSRSKQTWGPNFDRRYGEALKPEHVTVLGGEVPFEHLLEAPPLPDEAGPGWHDEEPSRFGRLSQRLWSRLLQHEELEL